MASEYITLGVTLPANIAITIGLALGIVLLSALIFFALPVRDGKDRLSDTGALGFLNVFSAILAPIWLLIFAHVIWSLWQLAITFEPSQQDADLRWHILAFIGLVTALGGLISAPLALIRVWTTERQTRTSEQGHMTDRISKAVEQLGEEKTVTRPYRKISYRVGEERETWFESRNKPYSIPRNATDIEKADWEHLERTVPNIEVRIGGLLSLERIAQDSTTYDKGRDHVRVMEILCAYVRENAPVLSLDPDNDEEPPFVPRTDVQIALDIIKRRTDAQIAIEEAQKYRLDLRRSDLRGTDLSFGRFRAALLAESRFEFSKMREADFSGAIFDRSVLNFVDCLNAKFIGANMNFCRIDKPEPQLGGFVYSINLADVTGLSLAGAKITALDYLGDGSQPTFGTKDTQLEEDLDEQRNEGAGAKMKISRFERSERQEDADKVRAAVQGNPFVYWSPHESSDMATGMFLNELRQSLNLTDWPWIS